MGRGLDGYFDIRALALCGFEGPGRGWSRPVSGGYGEGETPLPIPNRAVKPLSADGTWPARAWESRSPPVYFTSNPQRAREEHEMHTLGALFACPEWGGQPGPASEIGRIRGTLTAGRTAQASVVWMSRLETGRIARAEGGRT